MPIVSRLRIAGVVVFVVLTALLTLLPVVGHAANAGEEDVIVLFRDGVDDVQRERILGDAGVQAKHHFRHATASTTRASAISRAFLAQHPDVLAVVPDRPVEKLGKPSGGGNPSASAQVVPAGVQRIGAAPGSLSAAGVGIGVAVIDTGIDLGHPDLNVSPACYTAYSACQDDDGHGTHVSGIIAAKNNATDVVGVAPQATLYAVKVLDSQGSGTDSSVMQGLDWVAQNAGTVVPNIRVVNMSLGRQGTLDDNPALRASVQAVYLAGIVVVVAAGNDPSLEVSQQVPATYPEVMAIASTTALGGASSCRAHASPVAADTASYFTTDGEYDALTGIGVTVSAPGEDKENISRGCFLSSVGILSTRLGGGTTRMSGTSMAAPHVTGVVALMMEQGRAVAPEDVRRRLRISAYSLDSAPLDSPASSYSFDNEREGVVSAPGVLATQ